MSDGSAPPSASRPEPRLILCADDFAHSPATSRVIADLLVRRRLSATGCMTLRPNWRADRAMLADVPADRQIGLHLVLTDGEAPLTAMPRLAPDGALPRLADLGRGNLPLDEIAGEIDAQFDAFAQAMDRPPDFVDGHQHAHALPAIRDLVLAAARHHAPAAWVRVCTDGIGAMLARPWRGKALRSAALSYPIARRAAAHGVATNRGFAGHYGFAGDYARIFPAFLRRAGPAHLVMCHPGDAGRRGDAIAAARPVEAAALARLPLAELAARHGLRFD